MNHLCVAGKRTLVVRAGKEGTSVVLEIWGGQSLIRDLHVPSTLHGSLFNDGWFSAGVAWTSDEQRIAYVAEVRLRTRVTDLLYTAVSANAWRLLMCAL